MLGKIQNKLNTIWKTRTAVDSGNSRPILFQYSIFNEASCCTRTLDFKSGETLLELDRWSLATYPQQANALIVCGYVSKKAENVVRNLRTQLLPPQCVIFLGTCGTPQKLDIFSEDKENILYVPGCPVSSEDMHAKILKFVERTYAK